jgi:adenylosuccinate lyase
MSANPAFKMSYDEMNALMDAKNFVGRAPEQVIDFVSEVVKPIVEENKEFLGETGIVNV